MLITSSGLLLWSLRCPPSAEDPSHPRVLVGVLSDASRVWVRVRPAGPSCPSRVRCGRERRRSALGVVGVGVVTSRSRSHSLANLVLFGGRICENKRKRGE